MSAPVEVTTKYATTVPNLMAAWSFVMERVELVGGDPHIEIRPLWQTDVSVPEMLETGDDGEWHRLFEVVVEGMVREGGR